MSAIPLRTDYDAADVRSLARKASDADQVRRLLAIAAVYDGMRRAAAAAVGGMDRQSLCNWVHRFNADGPEGLHDRKPPGAPSCAHRMHESQSGRTRMASGQPMNSGTSHS